MEAGALALAKFAGSRAGGMAVTALAPEFALENGLLGHCPDYTVEPPVNRRVWADLRAGLDRDAYPAFPRNTEHAHAELARPRASVMIEN
jgi:hypothetical protein